MRALTVQQPWAWAIIEGGKDVENRTQLWSYRGPLAIHAGARISERGRESRLVSDALVAEFGLHPGEGPTATQLGIDHLGGLHISPDSMGAVLGVVDLVDIHHALPEGTPDYPGQPTNAACCDSPWAEQSYVEHGGRERRQLVHLVLENPRPITPIPAKGRLGLWTPDAELLAQINNQLQEA